MENDIQNEMENEDDELGLAPTGDDEERPIAPDIPFDAGIRLIPVICSACRTRLYAGENQVGLWKKCPVCDRLTKIRDVPPKLVPTADDPEAAGGYGIGEPEISKRDFLRKQAEVRTDVSRESRGTEIRLPPRNVAGESPLLESMLNRLLKSDEEKEEEETVRRRETQMEKEVEAVKKAAREGRLEEHLAVMQGDSRQSDPVARKLAEKQRRFENAMAGPPPLPRPAPTPESPRIPPVLPPTRSVEPDPPAPERETPASLWSPLFDPRCRFRMYALTLCGFLGNLFGEKARSMIRQILVDRVYGRPPGYSYDLAESGYFLVSFWIGAVLSIVWLALLFLLGISLFLETASGKDRVEDWIPFDLDFGLSYLGWTCLILFLSCYFGFLSWFGIGFFFPETERYLSCFLFFSFFFCFPVLFLCVIESDTFFGAWPRKTLRSFRERPKLWLRFYAHSVLLIGIPTAILAGLAWAGTTFEEYRVMQSAPYFLAASILLTFSGFFLLLYFRRLGIIAREIRSVP